MPFLVSAQVENVVVKSNGPDSWDYTNAPGKRKSTKEEISKQKASACWKRVSKSPPKATPAVRVRLVQNNGVCAARRAATRGC